MNLGEGRGVGEKNWIMKITCNSGRGGAYRGILEIIITNVNALMWGLMQLYVVACP